MSKVAIQGNASGSGVLTVAAPNTNSDYTLTLPAETGTVLTNGGAIDVNASAPADSLAISSAGNVGIGTSSPGQKLHVAGNTGSTIISVGDNTLTEPYVYLAADASSNVGSLYTRSNHPMVFGTNNDERMRIDSSGNVGIGTSSPNTASARTVLTVASAGAGGGEIDLTVGGTTALRVLTDGSYNTEFRNPQNSPLIFSTNNSERMRIDSSGNLLVGTTSTSPTSGVGTKILGGNVSVVNTGQDGFDFYNTTAGAYRFYVQANGTIAATNTTISAISDQRFKENIRDLDVGLAEIMQLRPRVFDWKEGKGKNTQNDRGFIAQEVEQVFPDLIDEWKDPAPEGEEPYKSVRQDLIPVLVKAIQELKAENDALKSRLDAVEALETRIAALEAGNVPT